MFSLHYFVNLKKCKFRLKSSAISSCCFSWFGDYRSLRFCALTMVGALFVFFIFADGFKSCTACADVQMKSASQTFGLTCAMSIIFKKALISIFRRSEGNIHRVVGAIAIIFDGYGVSAV